MADFSFLSDDDSDNEKAVNELLSQAMDLSVLEQVAAINCSGFTDSVLPTQLETRFRKLKSLPTVSYPSMITRNSKSFCSSELPSSTKSSKCDVDNEKIEGNLDEKKGSETNSEDGFVQELIKSKVELNENDVFLKTPSGKKGLKSKSLSRSVSASSSPSGSWNYRKNCTSPSAKIGCFWCSCQRGSDKKEKENRGVSMGLKCGKSDEFLSDLSTFSMKNQEKLLKKAMMEQEKINREAEKIVKWAKQASARMDVSSIEDELSDDDNFK